MSDVEEYDDASVSAGSDYYDSENLDDDTVQLEDLDGGNDGAEEQSDPFDITLPPTHSYLSANMVEVAAGRLVLEPGWSGPVPCIGHHSVIYPGETIPMLLSHPTDCNIISAAIQYNGYFGLLFPVHMHHASPPSGYGVLCEVFEATESRGEPHSNPLAFKARVRQRFRLKTMPCKDNDGGLVDFQRLKNYEVVILPEVTPKDMLSNVKLPSLDRLRTTNNKDLMWKVMRMDAVSTNWMFPIVRSCNVDHLTNIIRKHFNTLKQVNLPSDVVSLSFWAASNLPLSYSDRLKIFKEDNTVHRLRMEASFVDKHYILCCNGCGELMQTEISREEHIFAMSTEGMKSNFCNYGGYVHDIMTVTKVSNACCTGSASDTYSWFPGYSWTILVCKHCSDHVGWRYHTNKGLKPKVFYGICRNKVYPFSESRRIEN